MKWEHRNLWIILNDLRYETKFGFFSIIMRIHITGNKYTVNKIWKIKNEQKYTTNKYTVYIIWKMKNEQNYTNIYETESMQKHYLNY